MSESVRLKSFELTVRDINSVDIDALHALTLSVRWPHRPKDWEILRQLGHGVVAVDEVGRVYGSAMWFPQGDHFATIGLVITTPRLQAQGSGRWLMRHILADCGDRDLSLNATHAAYPMYLSLGFTSEMIVQMHQGELGSDIAKQSESENNLIEIDSENIGILYNTDYLATKIHRKELIDAMSKISKIYALKKDDEIIGYSMCREFGRGYVVGPIVARNDADAIRLAAVHMNNLHGQFVRVDTRERNGEFVTFLEKSGLSVAETVTTMSRGARIHNPMSWETRIYGLAGHALG